MNIGQVLELLRAGAPDDQHPQDPLPGGAGARRAGADPGRLPQVLPRRRRAAALRAACCSATTTSRTSRIAEILDAIDRGLEPPPLMSLTPTVPEVALSPDGMPSPESFRRHDDLRLSRKEVLKIAEISEELLAQLEDFGLVTARSGDRPLRHRRPRRLHHRPRAGRVRHRAAAPARLQGRGGPGGRAGRAGRRPAAPGHGRRGPGPDRGHRRADRGAVAQAARHLGEGRPQATLTRPGSPPAA